MKKLILLLGILGLFGCYNKQTVETKKTQIVTREGRNPLTVIIIEGIQSRPSVQFMS
jgi:hypothetical protein